MASRNREADYRWRRSEKGRKSVAATKRKGRYGITDEQYAEMLVRQEGRCAICRTPPRDRALDVDHDHETGEIRGLLCRNCNKGLGEFRDDAKLIQRAIDYLGGR